MQDKLGTIRLMCAWIVATLGRLVLLGGITLLLVVLLIFYPAYQAKKTIKQQAVYSSKAIENVQTASSILSSLPQIDKVSTQHLRSFRNYADQTEQAAQKLSKLGIPQTKPRHIFGYSFNNLISETNNTVSDSVSKNTYRQSNTDINESAGLMNYHAKISKALINLIEYNATEDTSDFSLGSSDTTQRLKLAASGLAATKKQLTNLEGNYHDEGLKGLISQVTNLQAALDKLSKDGDTANWIGSVSATQNSLITNRKLFWDSQTSPIKNKLARDGNNLYKINRDWLNLKNTYKII